MNLPDEKSPDYIVQNPTENENGPKDFKLK